MIRKIDSVSFGTKYMPKPSRPACNIKRELKAASMYAMSTIAAYGVLAACTSNKKQEPEPIQPKTEQIATTPNTLQQKNKSEIAPNGYYIVKDGDNIWNLSEALLKEKGSVNPTGQEIDKVKESIMLINNKKYPSDTCDVVMIHSKDTLWVDPQAYIRHQIENADLSKCTDKIGNAFLNLIYH